MCRANFEGKRRPSPVPGAMQHPVSAVWARTSMLTSIAADNDLNFRASHRGVPLVAELLRLPGSRWWR